MKESEFSMLVSSFGSDRRTVSVARLGLCREWTSQAIRVAREFRQQHQSAFRMEARERQLEVGYSHTYLALIAQSLVFLCDGTGTGSFDPYFGVEEQAPHLSPYKIDPIQYYDLADEE